MTAEGRGEPKKDSKVSRRGFVMGVGAAVVVAAVAVAGTESLMKSSSATNKNTTSATNNSTTNATSSSTTSTTTAGGFPRVNILNVKDLDLNIPRTFNYPLEDETNVLVKLGQKAQGGVGPDGDIVAFSTVCQHKGFNLLYVAQSASPACNGSYAAPSPIGYCCAHQSIYDFINGGKVLSGPAPLPLPQVMLEVDSSGDIYAYGMGPPTVYGHNTGSSDVSADLQG